MGNYEDNEIASACPLYGPCPAKTCLQAYLVIEGPDQPAHPRSLIRAFAVRQQSLDTIESFDGEQMPG